MIVYDINNANVVVGDRLRVCGRNVIVIRVSSDTVESEDDYGRLYTIGIRAVLPINPTMSDFKQGITSKKL
jgi:hypothetical protein